MDPSNQAAPKSEEKKPFFQRLISIESTNSTIVSASDSNIIVTKGRFRSLEFFLVITQLVCKCVQRDNK